MLKENEVFRNEQGDWFFVTTSVAFSADSCITICVRTGENSTFQFGVSYVFRKRTHMTQLVNLVLSDAYLVDLDTDQRIDYDYDNFEIALNSFSIVPPKRFVKVKTPTKEASFSHKELLTLALILGQCKIDSMDKIKRKNLKEGPNTFGKLDIADISNKDMFALFEKIMRLIK